MVDEYKTWVIMKVLNVQWDEAKKIYDAVSTINLCLYASMCPNVYRSFQYQSTLTRSSKRNPDENDNEQETGHESELTDLSDGEESIFMSPASAGANKRKR